MVVVVVFRVGGRKKSVSAVLSLCFIFPRRRRRSTYSRLPDKKENQKKIPKLKKEHLNSPVDSISTSTNSKYWSIDHSDSTAPSA